MKVLVIIHTVFIILTNFSSAYKTHQCLTPDSVCGKYVPIERCPPLRAMSAAILTSNENATAEKFVEKSKCSDSEDYCCPHKSVLAPIISSANRFTASDLPKPGECGTQARDRIIGGEVASIMDFPWFAIIYFKSGSPLSTRGRRQFTCGGALISSNYVLTAAHCICATGLLRSGRNLYSVRLGDHDIRNDPDCEDNDCNEYQEIQVADSILHETDDIALLRLERKARYTNFVKPICLPIAEHLRNRNYEGVQFTVAGYGTTESETKSSVKRSVALNLFNLNECIKKFEEIQGRNKDMKTVTNKNICAGGERGDSCSGDSGGPLMAEDRSDRNSPYTYLAGIVSFGSSACGTPGIPGVYVRVDRYINWILENMTK